MVRSVLTARLRKLTEQGVLERLTSEHPPRYEYYLAEKGSSLWPLITVLLQWGLCSSAPTWTGRAWPTAPPLSRAVP